MMRYTMFGPTGLRVSELSLGTMTFGEDWGWGSPVDEAKTIFERYAEAGGNFIDTANLYTNGTSERIVGELIAGERHNFVVATKFSLSTNPKDPNAGGNHRKNIFRALGESLERLQTDYIDIYWLHAWDSLTPAEEVMRALDDIVRSGRVHYIGLSDAPAWYLAKANMLAELRGGTAFAGIQMQYSLIERSIERELLPYAQSHGLTTAAWSPLGGGMLTGKYGAGARRTEAAGARHAEGGLRDYFLTDRNFAIAAVVEEVAKEHGCSMAQVALAWLRHERSGIIPILGARKETQLADNLASLELELTAEQVRRLDEVSAIPLGFPYDFLSMMKSVVLGEAAGQIDSDRIRY